MQIFCRNFFSRTDAPISPERRFAGIRIGFYEHHAAVWKIRFHAAVVDGKYTVRATAIIRGGTPITATQHSAKDKNKQGESSRCSTRFASNWKLNFTLHYPDFESLPDSKSPQPSAAAIARGGTPQKKILSRRKDWRCGRGSNPRPPA